MVQAFNRKALCPNYVVREEMAGVDIFVEKLVRKGISKEVAREYVGMKFL